ncbi:MAG: saccharopine dehydrogenase NADP-binding domain-containing protein [Acidobacteriota bacterium]
MFGASGFTGRLTAEALGARLAGGAARWAIAGRRRAPLDALADEIERSGGSRPGVRIADVGDPSSLRALAASTRVLATTVGPYARFGEPVVEAAIAEGCDYADITGEPEFVGRVLERHDAAARAAGVRIVNCCGFDSVPHDLGALLAVRALGSEAPIDLEGFVRGRGEVSGGTWRSALEALADPAATRRAMRRIEPTPGRRLSMGARRPKRERRLGGRWVAPLPTIDPWIVLRSAAALPEYGPHFRYGHYVQVGSTPKLLIGGASLSALAVGARVPPVRTLLLRWRTSGEGPNAETRARSRFEVRFFGTSAGRQVEVEVSGGDPGYGETSKMLAESALSLAYDDLPARTGVLTPAVALGDALIERLRAGGLVLRVV